MFRLEDFDSIECFACEQEQTRLVVYRGFAICDSDECRATVGEAKWRADLCFLRRTISSAPWLDSLDDEQWRVLSDEIMPAFRKAEMLRGGTKESGSKIYPDVELPKVVID